MSTDDRETRKPISQRLQVLKREDRGRRQKRDLLPVQDCLEGGAHRHFGLAVSDVATQQTIHGRSGFHVSLDVGDGCRLIGSGLVRETRPRILPANACPAGRRGPAQPSAARRA